MDKKSIIKKGKSALLYIAISLLFLSCNNEERAIRHFCEDLNRRYPAATLQDVYKTCFQDFFGAEHLMNDTAAARRYIHSELEQCGATDMSAMPKHEPTGFRHRFTRINLSCIVDSELTEEQLLSMFIAAAGKDNAYSDDWLSEWRLIEKTALEVNPGWADPQLQEELRQAAESKHAVRHSEAFRNTYNPHYRIVNTSDLK